MITSLTIVGDAAPNIGAASTSIPRTVSAIQRVQRLLLGQMFLLHQKIGDCPGRERPLRFGDFLAQPRHQPIGQEAAAL